MAHNIIPELQDLMIDIGEFWSLPGNPNQGEVEAVIRSFEAFGQRFPVAYRWEEIDGAKRRVVLAGNTRLEAARQLGWTHLAGTDNTDLSFAQSRAFAVTDNRTSQLAETDDYSLAMMLQEVHASDPELLEAASYTMDELEDLLNAVSLGEDDPGGPGGGPDGSGGSTPTGDLIDVLDVSIDDPTHKPELRSIWRLGHHLLIVCDLITEWDLFTPHLTAGRLFVPYPSPFVPLAAGTTPLVMVQPDRYLAGHVLDKWASLNPEPEQLGS